MAVATRKLVEDPAFTKAIAGTRSKALTRVASSVPWARCGNLALGLWLQASAFMWPHTDASRLSAWLLGLLISIVALLSMSAPPMRWLNAFLALWLLMWTFASAGSEPVSYINGVVSSLLVFCLAAVPSKSAATDYRD